MRIFSTMLVVLTLACASAAYAGEGPASGDGGLTAAGGYAERIYTGKIGDKYSLTMTLQFFGAHLSGAYTYAGKKDSLYLFGQIDPAGNVTLTERADGSRQETGRWTGRFLPGQFAGMWAAPDGKRKLGFTLHQDAESQLHAGQVMRLAVGVYPLEDTAGNYGANSMYGYSRTDHGWSESSSGISGGMREGSTTGVSAQEAKAMNSTQIVVDEALNIALYADGKLVVKFPYDAQGVFYARNENAQGAPDKHGSGEIAVSEPGAIHLSGLSEVPYSRYFYLEPGGVDVHKVFLDLRYFPRDHAFDLDVRDADDMTSGVTLSFRNTGRVRRPHPAVR